MQKPRYTLTLLGKAAKDGISELFMTAMSADELMQKINCIPIIDGEEDSTTNRSRFTYQNDTDNHPKMMVRIESTHPTFPTLEEPLLVLVKRGGRWYEIQVMPQLTHIMFTFDLMERRGLL